MKHLNLCEILKGHEGETFYSPIAGDVKLLEIVNNCVLRIDFGAYNEMSDTFILPLYSNGTFREDGEIMLFPSKDQRDWNKWVEEQKPEAPKIPKTCSDIIKANETSSVMASINCPDCIEGTTNNNTPIEKSALALLKIHQLIEIGYGGYPTMYEKMYKSDKIRTIGIDFDYNFYIEEYTIPSNHIAFHTKEQAEEFLKHSENIQLLKDYFIIQ